MNSSTQRNVVGAVMVVLGGAGFWLVRPTTTTESRRHSEATERPDLEPSRHANANVGGAPRRQTRHAEPAQIPVNGWDVPCHDADLTAAEVAREVVQGKPTGLDGGALLDGVYDVASYQVFGVPEQDVLAQSF